MDLEDLLIRKKLEEMAPLKEKARFDAFNRYGAVLDLDGNAWSDRFSRLLFFNTPILKQKSPWKEYFAHFEELNDIVIPFERNLSDLLPAIETVLQAYKSYLHLLFPF